jgi:alpha-2-macroglobulin
MHKRRTHLSFLLFLFFFIALGIAVILNSGSSSAGPTQGSQKPETSHWSGNFSDGWRQFDALTKEQKFEAASALAEKMLASARDSKNSPEWTRGLIRYTQLRISLHGFETAVRFLKDQTWPSDFTGTSVLNLYYAQALTTYARSYSWEINRRERTESKGTVDLKSWTRDQIYEEAQQAFENVWKNRNQLGDMPVTEWKEFITPSTYPAGIRPTLRDAVSYLAVEMLADTNGWRPEHLNEIFRLNLRSLIAGVAEISMVVPARHPLEKISHILADLENWHLQKKELEAALEARLERYRILHTHFREAEDRKLIQSDLENHLKAFTGVPWWSEGMAQLAEFIRAEDVPDSMIRARQVARQGKAAYLDSAGGRHCLAIEESIETPEYRISGMQNDNPQKKSLLVTHKNLEKVFFRAYPFNLLQTIDTSKDYSLLPTGKDLESLISGTVAAHQWEVALPATPDYRTHNTFVIPPMKKPGAYLIVASGRPGFPKADNNLQALYTTVGDLVLVTRPEPSDVEVTVLSGSSGKPVPGATVMLYRVDWNQGHRRADSKPSDSRGIARFHINIPQFPYAVLAAKEDEVAIELQPFYFREESQPSLVSATLLFTDRSIYRPLQKLQWKAVAYTQRPNEVRLETSSAAAFTVHLKDINGQTVESKTVTTNSFGTASGEFVIPAGRALGNWYLESSRNGRAEVQVEEYKRPTFEAKILDPEESLRLNKTAHVKGEAKYYFGLPVTNGQVKWLVRRQPVFPWWWSYRWWGEDGASRFSQSQVVASGIAGLKEDGTFSFPFSPEADARLGKDKGVTYRYSVSADITDEGGETRSAQRSFRLGFVAIEAADVTEKAYFHEDEPVKISLRRASLDGTPRAGKANWRIVALKGPSRTLLPAEQPMFIPEEFKAKAGMQTPGDRERERWQHSYNPEAVLLQWEEGPAKASGSVNHDAQGEGHITVPHLESGGYRLIYETVDDFGTSYQLQRNFVVAARSLNLPLPAIFLPEKTSVQVGSTARILLHSGLKDQLMVFEIYRDGKCIRRKEMRSGSDPSIVEIPITEEDRGGLGLSLTLVRDNQFIQLQSSLMVPWDNKELKLEFSTFRDRLRPGQQESWQVKVSSPAGKNLAVPAAELLAYMYDRSLDAFVSHSPANPMNLYPYRARSIQAGANLEQAQSIWVDSRGFTRSPNAPVFSKDRLLVYGAYGIGGPGMGRGGGRMLASARLAQSEIRDGITSNDVARMPAAAPAAAQEKKSEMASASRPVELRSEFSETAFWFPHLLTNADGSVTFEFKVPDSVTSWNVWVHAITRDLKAGSITREARSVKELMVRPYLPRFLREGDQAEIKVVVNNASDKELKGALKFDIIDTATEQSLVSQFGLSGSDTDGKTFTVPAGGGTNLTFPIKTPSAVGQIAFRVTATSGDFSDGELRPIPILPGRMHLMQSRFVTLKDESRRVIRFDDLARNNDPTRINEQMVVTLDAQLFYSVLSALPYLVNYPYECTEQTLNRFVSTGILSSLYRNYPAVERMARDFSSRQTQFEQWNTADPNRKMALEETPWLQMAKGGEANPSDLLNVLDSRIARAQRESALAKLRQSQTSSGGFPWFPGGPPDPFMTLYLLHGYSKALEFGVEVPREMVKPAWDYLHRHYLDELVKEMVNHDRGWEFVTFINYVLSNYPNATWYENSFTPAERKAMLDFSFKHWRSHSPYLKGYLALTLKRLDRPKDAMLVWESVMDSAKTAEDQGTFWAPEDRGWLWYNDTIETHAFAIRTEMELIPEDPKLDGMVLWIFLNKQLNHWKSTRATAEVIYSLAHYLKKTGQLGIREDASVAVGNQKTNFVFEPDQYTGRKTQLVIPGNKIDPGTTSSIAIEKTSKGHLFASATWHFSTEQLPEEERGDFLRISRSYFKRVNTGREFSLQPIAEGARLESGDEVEVHLSLTSKHPLEYVHLRDPRAAGFEPSSNLSRHKWDMGISWFEEIRDSGTNFFFERLPQGEYTFKYRIRATTAGTFKVAPATVQPMYAPEFVAYSRGAVLTISK